MLEKGDRMDFCTACRKNTEYTLQKREIVKTIKEKDYTFHITVAVCIHIHAPEGAIPKDGPSAGLAITTALLSELSGIPIKKNVAMTGEISLKGNAMPIGGLKEKSMAAYKAGCDTVIIPKDNLKDLAKISDEVKENVTFISVSSFDEVAKAALEYMPKKKDSKVIINTNAEKPSSSAVTQ